METDSDSYLSTSIMSSDTMVCTSIPIPIPIPIPVIYFVEKKPSRALRTCLKIEKAFKILNPIGEQLQEVENRIGPRYNTKYFMILYPR